MEKTRTCELFIDGSGILHVKILFGVKIDVDDAADNFLVARNLSNGKPVLKLVDRTCYCIVTKKARDFALSEDCPERTIAKAVLVNDYFSKLIHTLILKRKKPLIPIKFFLFESEALKWLNSFKDK